MASNKDIVLRQGHAGPKDIVLRPGVVADAVAPTTIYLYQGHATPGTIVLRPTTRVAVSGDAILAGTAAVIFGQLGSLAASFTVIGSATVTFGQSGLLASDSELVDDASLVFGQGGEMQAAAEIAGTAEIAFDLIGDFTAQEGASVRQLGDDALYRSKRPIVTIRPKIERDLDDVIETLEAIPESDRPPAKREAIRAARAVLKAVEAPEAYRAKLATIDLSLARAARAAAVHQGITAALATAAAELQSLTEELERKRLQRHRNEAIIWLLAA
jgi:hypothetical protein